MDFPQKLEPARTLRSHGDQARTRVLSAAAMGAIILLGIAVRARHLSHPMRYDESYNYLHYVSQGPRYIVTHYVPNNHILHTLSVWSVGRVAGHSPAALRIPAFIAGVLLIPATAWLAWALSRRISVALLASLGVCCSSALIEYSVNARGYSMLTLFAVLAAVLFIDCMERPLRRRGWICWGVCGAAGMYAVPIMALPLAVMVLVVAGAALYGSDPKRRSAVLRGLATGCGVCLVLSVLVYVPIVMTGGMAALARSQELAYGLLGKQITSSWQMASTTFSFWTRHAPFLLVIATSLCVIAYFLDCIRKGEMDRWMLLGIVVVPLLAAITASAPMPARTWLFALPFLFIMAAQGLADTRRPEAGPVRKRFIFGVQIVGALALMVTLINVWNSDYLCSEPRGLVLVKPALEECQAFDAARCALVAPYTPATAYYQSQDSLPAPLDASAAEAQRVYILTSADRDLGDLWKPGMKGFDFFAPPRMVWQQPGGTLYVAERAERNVLR